MAHVPRPGEQYTRPRPVSLSITCGVSGSGKTRGTQRLLENMGGRSGPLRYRAQAAVQSATDRRGIRSQWMTASTHGKPLTKPTTEIADCAREILSAGFPAIVDATFLKREQRRTIPETARDLSVPFTSFRFMRTSRYCESASSAAVPTTAMHPTQHSRRVGASTANARTANR